MTMHFFKLIWNRKRSNALIVVELFFAFLVVFSVVTFGVYYWGNYSYPLGFSYEHVWHVDVQINRQAQAQRSSAELMGQMISVLSDHPDIEGVAAARNVPYGMRDSRTGVYYKGRKENPQFGIVTDSFKDVMGLELVLGRWFGPEDDSAHDEPVVINRYLQEKLFGTEDPLGKYMTRNDDEKKRRVRVIGVVSDFRKNGELADLMGFMFIRSDAKFSDTRHLLIKVRPGTGAAFEESLMNTLRGVAPHWTFMAASMRRMRSGFLKLYLIPIYGAGTVAVFLMLMVGLGLTGVFWQTVTQRTKEMGLRRANGASIGQVRSQILGEVLTTTTLALVIGVVVILQFPILDLIYFLSTEVYVYSLVISAGIMYLLSALCGWYPSRLATRVQPVEALHYE